MKRFIFLLLGVLSTILPPIMAIMNDRTVPDIIGITLVTYCVWALISIIWILIWGLVGNGELPDLGDDIPFFGWVFIMKCKRIYYSDLGYFYLSIKGDYVSVHKQGFFMSHYLFNVEYDGNIESLKISIKRNLDRIYAKELEKSKKSKLKRDNLKSWDGYIDIVSKRDGKIKELLK